jgi:hypothetical protein
MKGGRFLTWVTLSVALSCVILLPVVQAQIQPP